MEIATKSYPVDKNLEILAFLTFKTPKFLRSNGVRNGVGGGVCVERGVMPLSFFLMPDLSYQTLDGSSLLRLSTGSSEWTPRLISICSYFYFVPNSILNNRSREFHVSNSFYLAFPKITKTNRVLLVQLSIFRQHILF